MGLRVLESESQRRWRDGQPSWDLSHRRKKHRKQYAGQEQGAPAGQPDARLYGSKGELVAPLSSLDIDV